MATRLIKVETSTRHESYRGRYDTAIIDFDPDGETTRYGGFGRKPTEDQVRRTFRALVNPSAVDERDLSTPEGSFRPFISSCAPDPEGQHSRWRVVAMTPFCD